MRYLIFITISLIICSCDIDQNKADAYGNFEATAVTVSAQNPGVIQRLKLREGQHLDSNSYVGYIDTTGLHLEKRQLQAQYRTVHSRAPEIAAQIEVLKEQLNAARSEYQRFNELAEQGAANRKTVDDLRNEISVLQKRIARIETKHTPIFNELEVVRSRIRKINHSIDQSLIRTPISGTVLVQLKEQGELAGAGTPLFRMAKLDTLTLQAYISGDQLAAVKLGQSVRVLIDKNKNSSYSYSGQIRSIAEEAEFTPKTIQTKEERVDLVYAMDVAVPNDGRLKVGMPAEVYFKSKEE